MEEEICETNKYMKKFRGERKVGKRIAFVHLLLVISADSI